jgi:hypothetical protein
MSTRRAHVAARVVSDAGTARELGKRPRPLANLRDEFFDRLVEILRLALEALETRGLRAAA